MKKQDRRRQGEKEIKRTCKIQGTIKQNAKRGEKP